MSGHLEHLSSIRGQVAVVTGGTAGIGGACTRRFAHEGATVIAIGRDAAKGEALAEELRAAGGDAHFIACDCAVESAVDAASKDILDRWGRADILCNIAGGWIEAPPIEQVTNAALHHSFDWNVVSKVLITQRLVPAMKANGYGRIVMMSSSTGRRGRVAAALQYSTMEAGVIGLTRRLAVELAPFGIVVNAIAPGTTLTPRAKRHSPERLAETARGHPGRPARHRGRAGARHLVSVHAGRRVYRGRRARREWRQLDGVRGKWGQPPISARDGASLSITAGNWWLSPFSHVRRTRSSGRATGSGQPAPRRGSARCRPAGDRPR